MSVGLPVSRLINANVNLSPLAAQFANFDSLLIVGDSPVIDITQRIRSYGDLASVAADFGTTAPEYLAADLFFSQIPQPTQLYIGRWAQTATPGLLDGGVLTPSQQLISNWDDISNGGVDFMIDGVARNLAGLDFTGTTNLNGVAAVIDTALSTHGNCLWNGENFEVSSATTGAGTYAHGTVTLTGNPANNDTLTVNGTLITLVTGTPSGSQVKIGVTAADTAGNLQLFLAASVDANIAQATYALNGLVITATDTVLGTAGNSFTLAKSATNITLSGATLTGGTVPSTVAYATAGAGTDISAQLKMTSTFASPPVPGASAESALAAVIALDSLSTQWYGLTFATPDIVDADHLAIAAYIQGAGLPHIYGVSIINTNILSSTVSNDLASLLKSGDYTRTFCQYSEAPYVAASYFGRAFTVDFNANNSTITLMYKQEPGVAPETLTVQQANTLDFKRCNYYVNYNNNTFILQSGEMSGLAYFDEIQGTDWLANQIQTDVYNLLYTSPTKVPQTDAGTQLIVNTIQAACVAAVNNGLVAPGVWNSQGFGTLKQGDFLAKGYYVYAPPVASQAQGDREARKSVSIQVAIKLAGAIQTVIINVNVNR